MILEIFVASASTVLKIIAALLVGAFMYGICFFFIYQYLDEVFKCIKCEHIKRIMKIIHVLPVVHLIFFPIMLLHFIVFLFISAYQYITDN